MSCFDILLVDDNKITTELLGNLLKSQGFSVAACNEAVDAVNAVKDGCFKMMVIDYRMPEVNGVELTRRLRPLCPNSYILGISIELRNDEFLSAGADEFMNKPFRIDEFLALVKIKASA